MTTAGTMVAAGPVATMIVPSSSPIPPVILGTMIEPWATELGVALVSFAAVMLVAPLVAGIRRRFRRFATASARSIARASTL